MSSLVMGHRIPKKARDAKATVPQEIVLIELGDAQAFGSAEAKSLMARLAECNHRTITGARQLPFYHSVL